jgi:hypothetical protein
LRISASQQGRGIGAAGGHEQRVGRQPCPEAREQDRPGDGAHAQRAQQPIAARALARTSMGDRPMT